MRAAELFTGQRSDFPRPVELLSTYVAKSFDRVLDDPIDASELHTRCGAYDVVLTSISCLEEARWEFYRYLELWRVLDQGRHTDVLSSALLKIEARLWTLHQDFKHSQKVEIQAQHVKQAVEDLRLVLDVPKDPFADVHRRLLTAVQEFGPHYRTSAFKPVPLGASLPVSQLRGSSADNLQADVNPERPLKVEKTMGLGPLRLRSVPRKIDDALVLDVQRRQRIDQCYNVRDEMLLE